MISRATAHISTVAVTTTYRRSRVRETRTRRHESAQDEIKRTRQESAKRTRSRAAPARRAPLTALSRARARLARDTLKLQQGSFGGGPPTYIVTCCRECRDALKTTSTLPPKLSLANGLWIGDVPWHLQVLTIPEQMLIALLFPRVFVFKLFPKHMGGGRDPTTLQRGMRGTVSTYELDMQGIASMVAGDLMPRPSAILASVISVTFIGLGALPKQWLRHTFRVRRQFVFEALSWLKQNNQKYYGDIEIDPARIASLPEDDVPDELLGVTRQSEDIGLVVSESEGYVPVERGKSGSVYDGEPCDRY